jgi:hypothetical protein
MRTVLRARLILRCPARRGTSAQGNGVQIGGNPARCGKRPAGPAQTSLIVRQCPGEFHIDEKVADELFQPIVNPSCR